MSDDHVQVLDTEHFIGVREAAELLSVSVAFLRKWRRDLPAYRLGGSKNGRIVFKPSELVTWAESRRVAPTASHTAKAS